MDSINPSDKSSWIKRASIYKQAKRTVDNSFFIPSFELNKKFSSEFLAVGISVKESKDSWAHGGFISQEFDFRNTGYRDNNKAFNRSDNLLINNVSIIQVPILSLSDYKLRYFPPNYFVDVKVEVWEYQGLSVNLLLQDLANFFRNAPPDLLINIPAIEQKIDDLALAFEQSSNSNCSILEAKIDKLLNCLDCNKEKPTTPPEKRYLITKLLGLL